MVGLFTIIKFFLILLDLHMWYLRLFFFLSSTTWFIWLLWISTSSRTCHKFLFLYSIFIIHIKIWLNLNLCKKIIHKKYEVYNTPLTKSISYPTKLEIKFFNWEQITTYHSIIIYNSRVFVNLCYLWYFFIFFMYDAISLLNIYFLKCFNLKKKSS